MSALPKLPDEAELILTADEVAALLRVKRSTVMDLHRRGALRSLRFNTRAVRFHRDDVLAYVERVREDNTTGGNR